MASMGGFRGEDMRPSSGRRRGEDISGQQWQAAVREARARGTDHGRNAAQWVEANDWQRVLTGIEEGDPEILDAYIPDPPSGEFAGDYSPKELYSALGGIEDTDDMELWENYSQAFCDAAQSEVERRARYIVGEV